MKKRLFALTILGVTAFGLTLCGSRSTRAAVKTLNELKAEIRAQYGENKKITGDNDKSLAVKCVNGTFIGKKNDGVIARHHRKRHARRDRLQGEFHTSCLSAQGARRQCHSFGQI